VPLPVAWEAASVDGEVHEQRADAGTQYELSVLQSIDWNSVASLPLLSPLTHPSSVPYPRPGPAYQSEILEKMSHVGKSKTDLKKVDEKQVILGHSGRRQPSHASSGSYGADSGSSANGSIAPMNDVAKQNQRHASITTTDFDFRMSTVPSCQDNSSRESMSQMMKQHGITGHDERLANLQSRTRAWLSTPQAYEIGMRREQRDEEQRKLYKLMQGIGLDNDGGKGSSGFPFNAAHQARPAIAEDTRRFELSGVGAWSDTNVIERYR
jgi:hypothetical protein